MANKYLEKYWGLDTRLPNIKKMFIPDDGYTICDVDLEQADAQVVAWESDCERLKAIFRDPLKDFHSENAFGFYEEIKGQVIGKYEVQVEGGIMVKAEDDWRQPLKAGAHATNYRTTPPTLAQTLKCDVKEAEDFIATWFKLNPEIKDWHNRTEMEVMTRGYVENKFGFQRRFLGRIDQNTLNEAQAWVPQSTVGLVINKGWQNIEEKINGRVLSGPYFWRPAKEYVKVLLQVHDSLVMQYLTRDQSYVLPQIRECMLVEIPYDDPLTIGVGAPALSTSSYGEVKDCSWETGEPYGK